MNMQGLKYLVVGAGFFGSVISERIATDLKEKVMVIDKRRHVGGNCYSEIDNKTGIECHVYGSHIFHTANEQVWKYINRFCSFNNYRHKVLTSYMGKLYQIPINLETINSFYGKRFTPSEAFAFIQSEIANDNKTDLSNLEGKAISLIGRPLYEAFIKEYTIKQWGVDPVNLPENIITRLPVRLTYKTDYFDDPWQGIPLEGYTNLFIKMLKHPNIDVQLGIDFFDIKYLLPNDCCVIFTGPIDRFFEYRNGALGWRTLCFEKEHYPMKYYQGTAVINYAEISIPFTRIHEFRHFHEERLYPEHRTVFYKEYPTNLQTTDEPFYPINTTKDKELLNLYLGDASKFNNLFVGGRLGTYKYLNMDQTIAAALITYDEKIKKRLLS